MHTLPDVAIPPGEYLEEVIAELGLSKTELARRMGRPASKLSHIFSGEKEITPDTAMQLEQVVGVPAHIWLGLQRDFDLIRARTAEMENTEDLQAERPLVSELCYAELAQEGLVAQTRRPLDRVRELRRFFGVTSLRLVAGAPRYQLALHRASARGERSPEALAAWLRMGEVRAQRQRCAPFDTEALQAAVGELRSLTRERPARFLPALESTLQSAGLALVICPHFRRTYAQGAVFWLNDEKIALMLTLRGNWADIFWFTLFHEIGHALLHLTGNRRELILENDPSDPDYRRKEDEANRFAQDALLPPEAYREFLDRGQMRRSDIERFALSVQIHPGIVVGRLQREGRIDRRWHNGLRARFERTGSHADH